MHVTALTASQSLAFMEVWNFSLSLRIGCTLIEAMPEHFDKYLLTILNEVLILQYL